LDLWHIPIIPYELFHFLHFTWSILFHAHTNPPHCANEMHTIYSPYSWIYSIFNQSEALADYSRLMSTSSSSCFSQAFLLVNLNRSGIALISPTPITLTVKGLSHLYSISLSVKRINPSGIFNSTFILRVLIATIIWIKLSSNISGQISVLYFLIALHNSQINQILLFKTGFLCAMI